MERLTQMNKLKLAVSIDPLSRFVNVHANLFAPILTSVINRIRKGHAWPKMWSKEEVTIIPKTNSVTDYSGCRNICCTSFFSKLCESSLLENLTAEISLRGPQFGGMKGSGPPHLLVEMMTSTLEQLDDNRAAVSTISLDFEKAFNRMDHSVCLMALASRGASNQTLAMTYSFLANRSMEVKIGATVSMSLPTPGGAPRALSAEIFFFVWQ